MRRAQPYEHQIQVKVKQWALECVPGPKVFIAFDRSRAQSMTQHIREKARGLRKGTSDTLLMVGNLPDMWVELKRPGNKPDDDQQAFGTDVQEVGRLWGWADSVEGYARLIQSWGVPITPMALLRAEHLDRVLAAGALRREESPKPSRRTSRARTPKPSRAALAAAARGNDLWGRTP